MKLVSTSALLAAAFLLGPTAPAAAAPAPEPVLAPPAAETGSVLLARRGRGADDPAGHDANDDRGRRGKNGGKGRGRGADDGPGHTWQDGAGEIEVARQGRGRGRGRGADDGPGDDRGRRGRGADDPPGHDAGDDHSQRGKNGGRGRGRGADDGPGHS
jgi:hypothetical protein